MLKYFKYSLLFVFILNFTSCRSGSGQGKVSSDQKSINSAYKELSLFFTDGTAVKKHPEDLLDLLYVDNDLNLPSEGSYGSQIDWEIEIPPLREIERGRKRVGMKLENNQNLGKLTSGDFRDFLKIPFEILQSGGHHIKGASLKAKISKGTGVTKEKVFPLEIALKKTENIFALKIHHSLWWLGRSISE